MFEELQARVYASSTAPPTTPLHLQLPSSSTAASALPYSSAAAGSGTVGSGAGASLPGRKQKLLRAGIAPLNPPGTPGAGAGGGPVASGGSVSGGAGAGAGGSLRGRPSVGNRRRSVDARSVAGAAGPAGGPAAPVQVPTRDLVACLAQLDGVEEAKAFLSLAARSEVGGSFRVEGWWAAFCR